MEIKKLLEHRNIIKKRKPTFRRKDWHHISNLGKSRKKKQVWRRAKGRHNKLRVQKKGIGAVPGVGYRSPKAIRGSLAGLKPILIQNESQLTRLGKNETAVMAHIGTRKKIQIARKALQLGIKFANLNIEKFLADAERKITEKKKKAEVKEKPEAKTETEIIKPKESKAVK